MKSLRAALLFSVLITAPALASEAPPLKPGDLDIVVGTDWTGSLTYLNYQEPFIDFTIPATLGVTTMPGGLELAYQYPDEPHANSTVQAEISKDGLSLMGEPIVSNTVSDDGVRRVKTAYDCEDMGRSASCEMTYTFSPSELRIKKLVTYSGETESFRRNEYVFVR